MTLLLNKNLTQMVINSDDYVKTMIDQNICHRSTYDVITKDKTHE